MWNFKKVFRRSNGEPMPNMPMSYSADSAPSTNSSSMPSKMESTSHGMMSTTTSPQALTVIELFQSQGCSSCPPTNSNIISLLSSSSPSQLILTYEVTYWDYLGWKDTFGKSKFDKRQRDYASVMGNRSVYTPQVIVNGSVDGVGNKSKDLQKIIENGQKTQQTQPLTIQISNGEILITGSASQQHDSAIILFVRYVPKPADVCIQRGENGGRTLPHRNVVTDISEIGRWTGAGGEMRIAGPQLERGEEGAILLQAGVGGPIVGAAKL